MWASKQIQDTEWQLLLAQLPELNWESGPWIAGGSARKLFEQKNWCTGDVDMFFSSEAQMLMHKQKMDSMVQTSSMTYVIQLQSDDVNPVCAPPALDMKSPKSDWYVYQAMNSVNASTYHVHNVSKDKTYKVQLVKARYAHSLTELWNSFDFTVSCFAADAQEVRYLPLAAEHVKNQQLVLQDLANTNNLPLRVLKHMVYGFKPSAELLEITMNKMQKGEYTWETEY